MNKKGQLDLEEFNMVGIIFGVLGGLISIIITNNMGGGIVLKILGFVMTGVVCYFLGSKIAGGD